MLPQPGRFIKVSSLHQNSSCFVNIRHEVAEGNMLRKLSHVDVLAESASALMV